MLKDNCIVTLYMLIIVSLTVSPVEHNFDGSCHPCYLELEYINKAVDQISAEYTFVCE